MSLSQKDSFEPRPGNDLIDKAKKVVAGSILGKIGQMWLGSFRQTLG